MSETPSLRFSAVGDITLGDHPMCVGFGAASRFRKEAPAFPFEYVKDILQGSQLCFGNLECTHSDADLNPNDYHSIQMRGKSSDLNGLVEAGFHVLNVANNHSLQHGREAFLQTCTSVRERGLHVCGANPENHLAADPTIVAINGLKVGFVGYSLRPRQYFEHPPLYTEGSADGILSDVRRVKTMADVVVVSVHWGEEFIQRPAPDEVQLARQIIDAGGHLVIGHHPHVLRGVEHYHGGVIAYSLGNFVCDMVWDETLRTSAILQCRMSKQGISDVNLIPIHIDADFRPVPVTGAQEARILSRLNELSEEIGKGLSEDLDTARAQYLIDADEANRAMRRRSHLFFLRNAWKYPKRILLQQLQTYARNRIHEITQIARGSAASGQ